MSTSPEIILNINAHLKYVEFILHVFDEYPKSTSLGSIREEFESKFHTSHPLLNQNFGIYRLLPIMLMKEIFKEEKQKLTGDIYRVKVIRDSIAHGNFYIDAVGYKFSDGKNTLEFTYAEFNAFIHSIENGFYENRM